MDCKNAIECIKKNYPPSNYTMLRESLDLAIKSLEIQEKIHEAISEIDRKYDNYDVMLIIEIKDILNELIID